VEEPAHPRLSDRRRRRRHDLPHGNWHQRPPRGRARQDRVHAPHPQEELGLRSLHRGAVAAQAGGLRRPGRVGERAARRAPPLPVRNVPLRALFEVQSFATRSVRSKTRTRCSAGCRAGSPSTWTAIPSTPARRRRRESLSAAAEVVVEPVEGNPGYYNSKFFLRPHYQLEGLTVSLRLVSKLPSAKAAG